ncbi:MAG: tyrosine-type recombinase/integrase [Rhodospirillales bacterium]
MRVEVHRDANVGVAKALRHTCASRIVQKGVNLKVVQSWMGHKSYRSTLRYAHLVPENLQQARLALESYSEG